MAKPSPTRAPSSASAYLLTILSMIAAISGCGAGVSAEQETEAAILEDPGAIAYLCGAERVSLLPDGAQAALIRGAARYELAIVRSASGARYADARGTEFWTQRDEAMFTLAGERQPACVRLDRLAGTWTTRIEGAAVSLTFSDQNRLSGYAGCNRMNESWRMDAGAGVAFGALTATLMQCLDGQNAVEQRLGTILSQRAFTLRFDGPDRAILEANDGSGAVELARASQPAQ